MIHLTRLNNKPLVVNSDLIKFIENAPDTVITLVSGDKIVVLESSQEIISRVVEYRRRLITHRPQDFAGHNSEAQSRLDCENPGGASPAKPREESD